MAQYQVRTGPITNTAATFEPSMVQGSKPDQPRLFSSRNQQGLAIAQPTHVQAAFTDSMSDGNFPSESRAFLAPRIALPLNPAMTTPVAAPFGPEMSAGWKPDRNREYFPLRQGWTISQTTQTDAAFSIEMAAGSGPTSPRSFKTKQSWIWYEHTFGLIMTPDMFKGWQPDTSRAFLAPRIPLPLAQPTHVSAPFGHEMVVGSKPDFPRLPFKAKDGWQSAQLTFLVQMTPEQWSGWLPSAPRIVLGPRIPLPISQPTQVSAPFTPDMVTGQHPDAPRKPFTAQQGWTVNQLTFIVQMTPDMFAGSHPDTNRQKLAPRIPLPIAQTTHTSAPFSSDMVQGSQPSRHRQTYGKQIIGWIQGLIQGLFGTPSQPSEFFNVSAQDRTFNVPAQGRFRDVRRRDTFAVDAQGRFVKVDDQDREFDS